MEPKPIDMKLCDAYYKKSCSQKLLADHCLDKVKRLDEDCNSNSLLGVLISGKERCRDIIRMSNLVDQAVRFSESAVKYYNAATTCYRGEKYGFNESEVAEGIEIFGSSLD